MASCSSIHQIQCGIRLARVGGEDPPPPWPVPPPEPPWPPPGLPPLAPGPALGVLPLSPQLVYSQPVRFGSSVNEVASHTSVPCAPNSRSASAASPCCVRYWSSVKSVQPSRITSPPVLLSCSETMAGRVAAPVG